MTSEDYIRKTFELAKKGLGNTWPNPLVGAVIVKNGHIIGSGYHHQHGGDHAELDAIKNATESLEGSTIYVNLEPCCHTNKLTPPCAQRLVQEKFKKVVICNLDPNPAVNGKGVELLRAAGIEVEHGVLEEEGETLNEVFFYAQRSKRPFVHLKLATTLDGMIALPNGESQWITGEKARNFVHLLRSRSQAIAVGAETVRKDNPTLNVRLPDYSGKQPKRIIFTKTGNLDSHFKVFTDEMKENTIVYSMTKSNPDFIYVHSLQEAMSDLFEKKIITLFIEGGAKIATSFMKENLINRVSLFMNPSFLGAGHSALSDLGLTHLNDRPRLHNLHSEWIGEDFYLTGIL